MKSCWCCGARLACLIWGFVTMQVNSTEHSGVPADGEDFYYFGYGSNLLRDRLQLQNPSAVQVAVGCLKGYKLAFGIFERRISNWGGGGATIIPSPDDDVWGVVWRLKAADRHSLDKQEGVQNGYYRPIEVQIQRENKEEMMCRTYQMNNCTSALPSPIYKEVICTGAKQSGLPAEYRKKLEAITTNNYNGTNPFIMEIRAILNALQNNRSIKD
ncbi:gamma-glutamylcyclotransferase-like [Scyliorhinus canicula]|uniref:gamma-glutamylcyclotransferase-like n=1 Tax=Scyliorhinus canicula TaxID=7830 RepID=UPI0018F2FBDA|nr:gamma-glutamylcyclotransferase-like [Scyliorhinus canicula]